MKQKVFPNFFQALLYAKILTYTISLFFGVIIGIIYIIIGKYNLFYEDFTQKISYLATLYMLPGLFIILKKSRLNIFDNTKFKFNTTFFICILLIVVIRIYINISYGALCNLHCGGFTFLEGKEMNTYAFIGSIFIAPIIEETLFRKIILSQFLKQYSLFASLLLSTFLFSIHSQLISHPLLFPSLFFGGFIYGVIYYKTKSVIYAIIAHSLHNLLIDFPVFKMTTHAYKCRLIEFLTSYYNIIIVLLLAVILLIILLKWKPITKETKQAYL